MGHRGQLVETTAENSLDAIEAALTAGADGVEVDVRATADGVAVCVHDADLVRLASVRTLVHETTYRDLREIALAAGGRIVRLDEVLTVVPAPALLVLDLKPAPGAAGPCPVDATLMALSGRDPGARRLVVSSFSVDVLDRVRRRAPRLRRAVLTGPRVPAAACLRRVLAGGHADIHPHVDAVLADHAVVETAHRSGARVRCWTVNREVDARLLAVAGIDGIITDVPGALTGATGTRRVDDFAPPVTSHQ